jgi:hypothetical protein
VYKNADLSSFYDTSEVDQFVVERLVEVGGGFGGDYIDFCFRQQGCSQDSMKGDS